MRVCVLAVVVGYSLTGQAPEEYIGLLSHHIGRMVCLGLQVVGIIAILYVADPELSGLVRRFRRAGMKKDAATMTHFGGVFVEVALRERQFTNVKGSKIVHTTRCSAVAQMGAQIETRRLFLATF